MNKSFFSKNTAEVILKNKTLRTACILIVLLLIIIITLLFVKSSYASKIAYNQKQIQDSQKQVQALEKIINQNDATVTDETQGRSFATYDQIVPFISLLESLFSVIDPESKITVKNQEKEIFINRYADYEVSLQPKGKVDLFLKGLDELQNLKYLTKIIDFAINYGPSESNQKNEIQDITLTIRLYFE
jgi:cysteinyl-tRNA synthetase